MSLDTTPLLFTPTSTSYHISSTARIMRPDGKIIYTGNDTSVNSLATGCYFVIIDNVSTFKVIVH